VRGRYGSEGTWRFIADDANDGYDVVSWVVAQPWSDGKVGTFGTSYPGGTQHALAEMNPPGLATMIPIDAVSNTAVAGMRHGGAFELRFMNWIFNIGAPNGREALADPGLRAALVESGRRIRDHVDSDLAVIGRTAANRATSARTSVSLIDRRCLPATFDHWNEDRAAEWRALLSLIRP
jgi:uncharacterized protein